MSVMLGTLRIVTNPKSERKLTPDQIRYIREAYETGMLEQAALARKFNVGSVTIWRIVHRQTYQEVA